MCGSGSRLAYSSMVPSADISSHSSSSQALPLKESTETTSHPSNCAPSSQEHVTSYLFTVQQQPAGLGFTEHSIKVITASWREGTTAQYQSHLKKWIKFCKEKKCNVLSPDLPVVLDFLSMLHENGLSYSTVNTARSMLSCILQLNINSSLPVGQFPIVKRFMKGIYELRPSLPKYTASWDLSTVLNYFRKGASVSVLSLKELTLKLTFLLTLLSGQRCQAVKFFSIKNMEFSDLKCTFVITEKVKQSRVGTHLKPVEFLAYPEDEKLCVIKHLQEYSKKTQALRGDCSQLLLSHVKPHGPASKDTISRWCKNILKFAGIDVSKFKAHSTRSASTSFLAERTVNIKDIMTSAGWSNEMAFQRYYHKPVDNTFNFGDTILQLADSDN